MSHILTVLIVAVPVLSAGIGFVRLMRAREDAERYESHAHVLQQLKKVIDSSEVG